MRDFSARRGASAVAAALLAAVLLALGAPVRAHDLWLVPGSFRPEPGSKVPVRILVGHGPADGRPLTPRPEWIERFVLLGPGGEAPLTALPGADPPGFAAVGEPGLYAVGLESGDTLHTLPPERFERYLAEEGLEEAARGAREAGRAPASPHGPVRELFARSVKTLLRVGDPGGTTPEGPVLDQELELVPLADPFGPEAEELPLRVLLRGEPAPGVLVEAEPLAGDLPGSAAVTDGDGLARLALPEVARPTSWLVTAVVLEPAPAGSDADWRSVWSSLTFERRPR